MCGILLVKSKSKIPLQQHLSAFLLLESRGPDYSRYEYKNNIFIGQTVLHITGTSEYYHTVHNNFLAYNGEIYNYRDFGPYNNDIEFMHHAVEYDLDLLTSGWGPWAWAWSNGVTVQYATDPQGEHCLYQFQNEEILIVCSEVAPILHYIGRDKLLATYTSRHWAILDQTPYPGVIRITPGQLYTDGQRTKNIDNIWSWIKPVVYNSIDEAYEEFISRWRYVIKSMTPTCPVALTYSGGLDTSIILSHLQDTELYTTNMIGKDPIAQRIRDFLTSQEQLRLHQFNVDSETWGHTFNRIVEHTCMPVQSWSFVGQWIISQNCQQRVLFTGAGADELFGGYNAYKTLDYSTDNSVSPYSLGFTGDIWQRCLDVYDKHAGQATLLADYLYQIAGCDARGIDTIAGSWGIEARNPFLAAPIMKLALNLPFAYKVDHTPKPLIRRLFLQRWSEANIMPKKGFTGHCNDALPWIDVDLETTGDRAQDWQQIVLKSFYTSPNQSQCRTIRV